MVHGRKGTKRCSVYVGSRFGPFCVLLLEKKLNAVMCKNYVNIYLFDVLTWKL